MLNLKIQLKIQYFKLGLISFHPAWQSEENETLKCHLKTERELV